MGTINAYDILNRILQYRNMFRYSNPVVSFEYVLNFEQVSDLIELLEKSNIEIIEKDDNETGKSWFEFYFLGCEVIINKNFPQ